MFYPASKRSKGARLRTKRIALNGKVVFLVVGKKVPCTSDIRSEGLCVQMGFVLLSSSFETSFSSLPWLPPKAVSNETTLTKTTCILNLLGDGELDRVRNEIPIFFRADPPSSRTNIRAATKRRVDVMVNVLPAADYHLYYSSVVVFRDDLNALGRGRGVKTDTIEISAPDTRASINPYSHGNR